MQNLYDYGNRTMQKVETINIIAKYENGDYDYVDPIFKKAYSSFYISRLIGNLLRFKFKNFINDSSDLSYICMPNIKLFFQFSKREIYIHLIIKIKRFIKNIFGRGKLFKI